MSVFRNKRGLSISLYTAIILIIILAPGGLMAEESLIVGEFSAAKAGGEFPEGWQPLTFKNIKSHTRYDLVADGDDVIVRAESHASSSGLVRRIRIDPKEYPVIRWRWKATNIYAKGDVTKKSGDDYPARIYIMFEYDPRQMGFFERTAFKTARLLYGDYLPGAAMNYIWGSNAEKGTSTPNPYTGRAHMIVVESGEENLGRWIWEERNVCPNVAKVQNDAASRHPREKL